MSRVRKVILGISGGVDSAVAALFLKIKGFDVTGVFMKNWDLNDESGLCTSSQDEIDSQRVCDILGIKFESVNFVKEYWNDVFSYFLSEYMNGGTPNPDIMCNRKIKFDAFFYYARNVLYADAIATGHYARTSFGDYLENFKDNQNVRLLKAVDSFKDQTFFLSQVKQLPLKRSMFPLGNLCKNYVKQIALDAGMMKVVKKKESMGMCFIGFREFQNFISEYVEDHPGPFIDIESGNVMGEHSGVHNWTIGQRCRLPGLKEAGFVARKDVSTQTIYVAFGANHPALFTCSFIADRVHWIHSRPCAFENAGVYSCSFRFQHTKPLLGCHIVSLSNNRLFVKLDKPVRALTPGQYAVFYSEQECLGSSRITEVGPSLFSLDEVVPENILMYSAG